MLTEKEIRAYIKLYNAPIGAKERAKRITGWNPQVGVVAFVNMTNRVLLTRTHAQIQDTVTNGICQGCKGPMSKGPFNSACRVCEPAQFRPCGICKAALLFCCC